MVRRPFHRNYFWRIKIQGCCVCFFEKWKFLSKTEWKSRSSHQQQPLFCHKSFLTMSLFRACGWKLSEVPILVFSSWIVLHIYFKRILIMVTKQLFWRKIRCDCFCSLWLWLLLAIIKRCTERCELQLICTSLDDNWPEIIFLMNHFIFSHILRKLTYSQYFFVSCFQESLPYFWLTIFRHNV